MYVCLHVRMLMLLYAVLPNPCETRECPRGHRCLVYQPGNEAYCQPDCVNLNPCQPDELCVVEEVLCVRAPCPGLLVCKGIYMNISLNHNSLSCKQL